MRNVSFVLLVAAAAVLIGCQSTQLVRACDACGCECVAAPILANQPCGTHLEGGGPPVEDVAPEAAAEPEAPLSAFEQKLDDTTINLMVTEQPFRTVVQTLQVQTGLNITIEQSLDEAIGDTPIVALKLVGVKVSTALSTIAAQAGEDVEWTTVDEVVVFRR